MGLIWTFALAVGGLIGAILVALFTDEFKAWRPWLTERLVARAVRNLPHAKRERYAEEWPSYIAEIPGEFGKLIAALDILLRASRAMNPTMAPLSYLFGKRAFDIAFSFGMMLSGGPLFLLVSTAIAMDTRQIPVVKVTREFRGRKFQMFRFRTCVTPDGSLSRTGYFVERLALGVLPLFYSVFRGDISIVGPTMGDSSDADAKPGLIGLPQLFDRFNLNDDERKAYNDWYIEHRSFRLDMYVLSKAMWLSLFK